MFAETTWVGRHQGPRARRPPAPGFLVPGYIVKRAALKRQRGAGASARAGRYVLRLYVTGMTELSARAISSIRALCEEHLKGRYRLQVVDLYSRPQLTRSEQIIAAPTLIKQLPLPLRRMVGDFSDRERVLFGLDLREARR